MSMLSYIKLYNVATGIMQLEIHIKQKIIAATLTPGQHLNNKNQDQVAF